MEEINRMLKAELSMTDKAMHGVRQEHPEGLQLDVHGRPDHGLQGHHHQP
ncbi:MAG: hypothetical protein MZU91_03230 [Desulfosudis oleivorans]|nr:hypothetical protein [Desulfosudis oleivorans]